MKHSLALLLLAMALMPASVSAKDKLGLPAQGIALNTLTSPNTAVATPEPMIKVGSKAPDFSLKMPSGKILKLSSLRGKYVLLDFWGSWCPWCIKGIPEMKKAYAKHKRKLKIVSIDCRDTEERWREALDEYKMPWLHVKDEPTVGTPSLYDVHGYPTKILINPNGTINFIFVGEDAEFYTKLDQALRK